MSQFKREAREATATANYHCEYDYEDDGDDLIMSVFEDNVLINWVNVILEDNVLIKWVNTQNFKLAPDQKSCYNPEPLLFRRKRRG